LLDGIFAHNDVLGFALNAYIVRNDVIQHNIANVDTPGFKKKAVDFETAFAGALEASKRSGVIDLNKAAPKIRVMHQNFSFRLDGNNVDIDIEMSELYKNSVKYDVLGNSVMNNYRKINLVSAGR